MTRLAPIISSKDAEIEIMVYIHELEDWPRVPGWNAEKLGGAPRRRPSPAGPACSGGWRGLGFNLRAEATLQTLTEEVIKSSEIEGEILDRDQVRSSIARRLGMDIGALDARRPQCRRRRRDDARRHPEIRPSRSPPSGCSAGTPRCSRPGAAA